MTTGGANLAVPFHRVERRAIPPFGDGTDPNLVSNILDGVLAKCRFAPFADGSMSEQDTHLLSIDELDRDISPQFEIVLDRIDELSQRLDLRMDDLAIGLTVRAPHLRRYEVLQRWDMSSLPQDIWSPNPAKLKKLQSGRGIDFILGVQVSTNRKPLILNGLAPGKVICRKVFSVKAPDENFTFPVRWCAFGGDTDYPEEALWVIEWQETEDGSPTERPIQEALVVWANEKAEPSLRAMASVQGGNDLAWRMLAADITTQIWADVLAKSEAEPPADDTESLAGQVFARLSTAGNMTYAELQDVIKQDDSLNHLRSLVAKVFRVVT